MEESTRDRLVAVLRLAVTLVAAVAGCFGLAVDADALYTGVCLVVALVAFVWSWYRNSNLTEAAQQAQNYLDSIKAMKRASEGEDEADESEDSETAGDEEEGEEA